MEENLLIEKARKGDKLALAELVKNYEQTIYNFSFKICRDKDRAEHTMQETFMSMVNLPCEAALSTYTQWEVHYPIVSTCLMMKLIQSRPLMLKPSVPLIVSIVSI